MRIKKTARQTPDGLPLSSSVSAPGPSISSDEQERFVWVELAPRLIHPTKLAFIELLLAAGEPLSLEELAEAVKTDRGHAEHHCKRMEAAEVLEVVGVAARAEGRGEEPSYFFPKPPKPASTA
jgi:predicted transcriptional regulator